MEDLGLKTPTSLLKRVSFGTESDEFNDDDGGGVGGGLALEQKNENGPRFLSTEKWCLIPVIGFKEEERSFLVIVGIVVMPC